jgi:acyl dehydratase
MAEDIKEFVVGREFLQTFTVTDETYQKFQECSKDMNPLHTDEAFAKDKGFTGKVMYGNILNAFISYFVGMCLPTKNVVLESQGISYHKPIYMNDTVNLTATVNEVHENINVVMFKYKFRNGRNELVAKGNIQIGVLA